MSTTASKKETSETTVKCVKFEGKEHYEQWSTTIKSCAKARGYLPMMTNKTMCENLITDEENLIEIKADKKTAVTEIEKKLYQLNSQARAVLLTSFCDPKPELVNMHKRMSLCETAYEMW